MLSKKKKFRKSWGSFVSFFPFYSMLKRIIKFIIIHDLNLVINFGATKFKMKTSNL